MLNSNKAVFLDMQGTLGGEGLGDIRDFNLFPFSKDAIKLLNNNNLLAIIVTNQCHISKGYFTYKDFENKMDIIKRQLNEYGAFIDGVYCCPHGDADKCSCMKPLPGMLLNAKRDFNINLENSYVIGDMGADDIVMAKSVGAKGILVRTGVGEGSLTTYRYTWADVEADYIADNVLKAVLWIVNKEKQLIK